jgi:hypothetical protein
MILTSRCFFLAVGAGDVGVAACCDGWKGFREWLGSKGASAFYG